MFPEWAEDVFWEGGVVLGMRLGCVGYVFELLWDVLGCLGDVSGMYR